MRIVLLGPPGSGKAKFCELIGDHLQLPVLTSNGVLQRAAAEDSELGRLAGEAMHSNRVSDELLLALLRVQLAQPVLAKGFVLVDFPRNAAQADVLDSILDSLGRPLDLVLYVHVDPDELMERLVGRITCEHCGAQYNLYVNPPTVEGVCDVCGTRVSRRPDDYEDTISNRLRIYEGQTGPLLQYYALHNKLHKIAGDAGVQTVWPAMREIIDATPEAVVKPEAPAPVEKAAPTERQAPVAENANVPVKPRRSSKKIEPESASVASEADLEAQREAGAKPAMAPQQHVAKKRVANKRLAKQQTAKQPAPKKKGAGTTTAARRPATAKKAAAKKKTITKKKAAAKQAVVKKSPTRKKVVVGKVTPKKTAKKKLGATKAANKQVASAKSKKLAKKKVVRPVAAKKKPLAKRSAIKKKPTAPKTPAKKASKKKSSAGKKR